MAQKKLGMVIFNYANQSRIKNITHIIQRFYDLLNCEIHVVYIGDKICFDNQYIYGHYKSWRFAQHLPDFMFSFIVSLFSVYKLKKYNISVLINVNNSTYIVLIKLLSKILHYKNLKIFCRVTGNLRSDKLFVHDNLIKDYVKKIKIVIYEYWEKLNYCNIDGVIAISEYIHKRLLRIGVNIEKIKVISTGVNTDKFSYSSTIQNNIINRILFVGRIVESKGIRIALESFLEIYKIYDLEFDIFGDGIIYEELKQIYKNYPINFNDNISYQFIERIYSTNSILLLPSYYEVLPNVILEAMSSGVPVIASSVGEIPRLIGNDERGILIDPYDKSTIIKAMERMITDNKYRAKCRETARRYIVNNHGFEIVRKEYFKMFFPN